MWPIEGFSFTMRLHMLSGHGAASTCCLRDHLRRKTEFVTPVHSSIHRLAFVTATLCVLAINSHVLAAETTQAPRPHSLIHRQAAEVTPPEAGISQTTPSTTSAPATRSPQRKLTKRPSQLPAAVSSATVMSQATTSSPQAVSPVQTNKTGTESRISVPATGVAALGASTLTPASTTSAGSTSVSASVTPAPSPAKTPVATAVPGIGPATTLSPRVAAGRGLQSLSTQMPGLTQLVAPTVSVSSPPPSPAPSPVVPQSLPSSSPPPTTPPPPPGPTAGTGSASLSWTLNSEPDLAGYKIYVGTAAGLYTYPGSPFVVGLTGNYTITGLPVGQTYFFAISAFDSSGGESGLSSEVSKSIY